MNKNKKTAGQNDNTPLYARRENAVPMQKTRNPTAYADKLRAFSFRRMVLLFSPSACNYCR